MIELTLSGQYKVFCILCNCELFFEGESRIEAYRYLETHRSTIHGIDTGARAKR